MATYSLAQIAQVAYAAGFRGDALVTATAVAFAESSGRTDVVNSIGCVGLWQIYQKVHPWAGTIDQLKNPATNARAAYVISNHGTTWKPWEAYTRGMHVKYLAAARAAVESLNTDTDSTVADFSSDTTGPTNPRQTSNNANPLAFLSDGSWWINALMLIAGLALILIVLIRITGAGSIISTATDFIPGGGVLKKVAKVAK